MAVFTHVAREEAAEWATRHFCLPAADTLSPIAEGIENTNYLMSAGDSRYVFTIFEIWDAPMADYYAALMRHLSAAAPVVPAPLIPQTSTGGNMWGDKPCSLTPYIKGRPRTAPTADDCRKMGAVVAGLHCAAAGFMPHMPNPRGPAWRREITTKLQDKIPAGAWQLLQDALFEESHFNVLPLPAGACHCDLFRNNILWQDGEITGVIDFYFGGDDALIFDLAVCACDWCFNDGDDVRAQDGGDVSNTHGDVAQGIGGDAGNDSTGDIDDTGGDVAHDVSDNTGDARANADGGINNNIGDNITQSGVFDAARLSALLEGYESRRPLCALERAHFHHALCSAALRFWISRLYDFHYPRRASLLTAHNPEQFETILLQARQLSPLPQHEEHVHG